MHTSLLARLGSSILSGSDLDLRERFYDHLCLISALVTLFVVLPTNAAQNLPPYVSVVVFVFSLASIGFYVAARRGRRYPGLFLACLLLMMNAAWSPNAGTYGSPLLYWIVPTYYTVTFFTGRQRITALAVVVVNALALIALEYAYPGTVDMFERREDRYIDLTTGFIVSTGVAVLMLWMTSSSYERERARLRVAVDALTETEDRLARMFQANPDSVIVFDTQRELFVDVNEGFTTLTGFTREDAVGRNAVELGLWLSIDDRRRLLELVATNNYGSAFISQFRRKNGTLFWGSTSFRHMDDRSSSLLLTTRDITAQREAEQAVAASRAELLALINSTSDLIWVVEPQEFRLVVWNDAYAAAMRRLQNLEVREGQALEDLLPAGVVDNWRSLYTRALREGPFTTEYVLALTGDVVLLSFNTLRHEDRTTGLAIFSKDITERKHEEERRSQMELQLYEGQKMESLGSLAGGVAHDFNNMLGAIMGYADLMLADETEPHKREDLGAILQAATRSSELTRKLLAFGRRGKNIVEPVDLNSVVHESVGMLRPSFGRNVRLDIDCASESTIDGDPSQLNQLVVNLCINAGEAMPAGGRLSVCTADAELDATAAAAARVAPGAYVRLTVADTGVGIPDAVKARIFEPFFTTKTRGRAPGTGLGLSTVYGIVHLHHGSIAVDSTVDRGTTFTVLLPQGSLALQEKPVAVAAASGHGLILVVEDEPLLRRFATSALARLGYAVLTAADGEEGVAIYRARHGELSGMLLDLKMPKKDGRETFIECHAINPAVPVLICSGYGDNEEAQGLISLGARGLLAKPYRVSVLGEMLAQVAVPPRSPEAP